MDLTSLSRVKQYLQGTIATNTADTMVSQLISRASDVAMQFTGRNFQRAVFASAKLNGTGTDRLMLPQNPIIAVTALSIYERAVPAAARVTDYGYQWDEKFLYLCGGAIFCRDRRNVAVAYSAGYVTQENQAVPSGNSPTLTPVTGNSMNPSGDNPMNTAGPALVDRGVVYEANGVALVAASSAPSVGQYSFANGSYSFNTAQAGVRVAMTYDYCPGSVEQAVCEMVGIMVKRRDNLGISSRSLDRETITYDPKNLPRGVKELLAPYAYVISP